MAEEKRGQPRVPEQPQRGLARPGQGTGQPRQGSVRPGQGTGQPRQGSVRPGQGSGQLRQGSVRPGQGTGQLRQGSVRPGQGTGQPRQGSARPGQGSGQPRQGSARPLQRSIQPPRGLDPALRESLQREPDPHEPEADRPENEPGPKSRARKSAGRQRSTKARVAGALLYALFVIGASAVLATVGWTWACDLLGLNKEYVSTEITIADDTDFSAIVDRLEEEGLIQYKFLFKLYAQFSHAEDKIAPGTYVLDTEMDYHALVSNMGSSSATRQTTDVTIPEGYSIDQIFSLLEEKGVSTEEKLRDMAANWNYAFDWLQDIPLGDYHRLEGYLFPDTYTFQMGENPKYIINKMLVNFDDKMEEYFPRFTGEEAQYSLHDIVTIASLVEKETDGTNDDERSDYKGVASVIYNRLEHPDGETSGFLQIDATLVYINGGRVPIEADKSIDSPYNTYLYEGLPAGPITNPGMASLLAAMEPDSTGYYYYVLNPETGQHEYSRTYAEHQALLERYHGNG